MILWEPVMPPRCFGRGLTPEYLPIAVSVLAGAISFSTVLLWNDGTFASVAAAMVKHLQPVRLFTADLGCCLDGAIWEITVRRSR